MTNLSFFERAKITKSIENRCDTGLFLGYIKTNIAKYDYTPPTFPLPLP